MYEVLRIGTLGAAPIAVPALIRPARKLRAVEVAAIAARDSARGRHFARRHGIPHIHQSYDALLADPAIDAVYIPLPNSLHAPWAERALRAGKHVLCEKPLAANAREAAHLARMATESGLMLVEAFHYRYHPLAARLKTILDSGEIGAIRRIETEFSVPFLPPSSIQFRADLAGGATMDVGCYAINLLRFLAGAEPRVTQAEARLFRPQVDRLMRAEFAFDDGRSGGMVCALLAARMLRLGAVVYGTVGELRVSFPFLAHIYNRVTVRTARGTRHERVVGATTYDYQLAAFADAVKRGAPPLTGAADAIANMRVIDAVYQAAGLRARGE